MQSRNGGELPETRSRRVVNGVWHPSRVSPADSPRTAVEPESPARRIGRPPRSADEREARRAELLERTMDAIRGGGPDLSMDDLAAAAGVSKPVLYDELGDRTAIADAVASALADTLEQQVVTTLGSGGVVDFERIVHATVDALVDLTCDEPHLYSFLARTVRWGDRGFPDNGLVQALHARAAVVTRLAYPPNDGVTLGVLTDGLFGFTFAAIASWQRAGAPNRGALIDRLTTVIVEGFRAAAR